MPALAGGGDFSHDDGRARSKREKPLGRNLTAGVKFAQVTGAGLNRCQYELPALCRLRLTPFRPEPLRRSCNCPRGRFASLTQGPRRLLPLFVPGSSRSGGLPVLLPVDKLSSRREAREEKNVPAATHQVCCGLFNRSEPPLQAPKSLFLFWAVHCTSHHHG